MADYPMQMNEEDARAALNATRRKLATHMRSPAGWHMAFAAIAATEVGAQALGSPWSTLAIGVLTLALCLLIRWSKTQRGLWVNGWKSKRARWASALLVGWFAAAIISALFFQREGQTFVAVALGVVTFPVILVLSILKERLHRSELESAV